MIKAVIAQTFMELKLMIRRGEALVVTLAIPVGVLVFFTTIDVLPSDGSRGVDYLVGGVLALAVISSAMVGLGIATGFERQQGVLKRFGATPLGRLGLLEAKIASTLVMLVIQILVIGATGLALGWHPQIAPASAVITIFLGVIAFAGIGFAMAGLLRAEANLALSNALFLAMLLVGGIVAPVQRLPAALRAIAQVLPAAPLANAMRASVLGKSAAPADLAALAIWAVLSVALSVKTFKWEP